MKHINTIFGLIVMMILILGPYSYADFRPFPNHKPGTEKWEFGIGSYTCSSPAVGKDGTIYITSGDKVYALTPEGPEKWENRYYAVGYSSSPAIGADGTIYVGGNGGILEAINPDGTEKWRIGLNIGYFSDLAIGEDGTIYADGEDPGDGVYAINPNGSVKWHFTTSDADDFLAPSVGPDGTIYVSPEQSNTLYAISSDGKLKWKYTIDNGTCSPAAIGKDGTIYVNAYSDRSADSYLYAINPDGTLKWKSPTGHGAEYAPAIGKDGTIYVALEEGYLYAINPDGTLKWKSRQTYGYIHCSPAIGSYGTIYISSTYDFNPSDFDSSSRNYIYAINPKDGTFLWTPCEVSELAEGLSMAVDYNILYATFREGGVVAINIKSDGLADSDWPRARHENQNTGRLSLKQTYLYDPTSGYGLTYISINKGAINKVEILEPQQAENDKIINTDNMPGSIGSLKKVIEVNINKMDNESSTTITISDLLVPSSPVFYKYVNGNWINLETCDNCSFTSEVNPDGTYTISFAVKDNGELDSDNTSGIIKDPVVVGEEASYDSVPPPPTSSSTTSESSESSTTVSSGGGCTTSNSTSGGLILILLAAIGFAVTKKLSLVKKKDN